MKILIVGGGAMGLTHGALFSEAAEVSILVRSPDQADEINTKGIVNFESNKSFKIKAYSSINELKNFNSYDYVVFTLKAYDIKPVTKEFIEIFGLRVMQNKNLVYIFNGMGVFEELESEFGFVNENTIAFITGIAARRVEPNSFKISGTRASVYGSLTKSNTDSLESVLEKLDHERIKSESTQLEVWKKFKRACVQNALSAITAKTFGELAKYEDVNALLKLIIDEIDLVASLEGFDLTNIAEDTFIDAWKNFVPKHYSSLHNDVVSGKRTEIDYLNGEIIRLANNHNVRVPVNEMITHLTKIIEN
jgi:2-dehydropantoate 2-reductase